MRGHVAFITGAASGIGKATARAFLDLGVSVALVDVDREGLNATASQLKSHGPAVMPIVADLSETDHLAKIFQSAVEALGQVNYLVNGAALIGGTYDLLEIRPADWDKAFQLNLKTPMLLMQAFARHAIARKGGGRIVNVSSSSAFRVQRSRPAYGSSKGGLNTLTRIAAAQWGQYDINVNAVAPGITNTPAALRGVNGDLEALRGKVSDGPNANFFKRLTEAEDVAAMITFLCSPGSRQVTGQIIQVSAGTITP
jgi:NAD(P)-dependent dehydrogenase (short-subunit alcohol dehydrogenase family)